MATPPVLSKLVYTLNSPLADGEDLLPKKLVRNSDWIRVDLPRPDSPDEKYSRREEGRGRRGGREGRDRREGGRRREGEGENMNKSHQHMGGHTNVLELEQEAEK